MAGRRLCSLESCDSQQGQVPGLGGVRLRTASILFLSLALYAFSLTHIRHQCPLSRVRTAPLSGRLMHTLSEALWAMAVITGVGEEFLEGANQNISFRV